MPSIAQIANAMTGSLLLARRDTDGYRYFDFSVDGFWRSFLAVFLILPFYLAIAVAEHKLAIDLRNRTIPYGENFLLVRFLALAIGWVALPLAMVWVCRMLRLQQRYVVFIIVYNWSSVPAMALPVAPFLLYQFGLFGAAGTVLLYLIVTACVVYYRWFIALTALKTTAANAAGIVALDIALGLAIWNGLVRLFP